MLKQNPFDASFSSIPPIYLNPKLQSQQLVNSIETSNSGRSYFITGVRGSGKTVLMHYVENILKQKPENLVIDLENNQGLLQALFRELTTAMHPLSTPLMQRFNNIGLEKLSINLDDESKENLDNVNLWLPQITPLLEQLKHQHKRLIVGIDEVTNSTYIQQFAQLFNNLKGHNLPIFAIMTGLPQVVTEVQNEERLTFLLRSERIITQALSLTDITIQYQQVFECSWDEAVLLTKKTGGYAYAFQLLGDLVHQHLTMQPNNTISQAWQNVKDQFKSTLFENAYAKIYSPLSAKLRAYLFAAAREPTASVIRINMHSTTTHVASYRARLLKQHIIVPATYGKIKFVLPFFDEYVLATHDESSLFYIE